MKTAPQPIQAFLFDLDGTLVDSNDLHVESWDRAFRHFGKTFSQAELRARIGKGSDKYLPEFLTSAEIEEFGSDLNEYRSALFKKEYLPRPSLRRTADGDGGKSDPVESAAAMRSTGCLSRSRRVTVTFGVDYGERQYRRGSFVHLAERPSPATGFSRIEAGEIGLRYPEISMERQCRCQPARTWTWVATNLIITRVSSFYHASTAESSVETE